MSSTGAGVYQRHRHSAPSFYCYRNAGLDAKFDRFRAIVCGIRVLKKFGFGRGCDNVAVNTAAYTRPACPFEESKQVIILNFLHVCRICGIPNPKVLYGPRGLHSNSRCLGLVR